MTTPADIIMFSLRQAGVVGVGQEAEAEDYNDALTILNDILAQWNRKRWLIYHLKDLGLTSTGAQFYTIGAGGDFDAPRPDRLEAAYYRQLIQSVPNQVDYPLKLIMAYEDYSRIRLKMLTTVPTYVFYDSAYPLGKVYPWPLLQSDIYELHIIVKDVLESFTTINDVVNLPPEYEAALRYNLSARLRPMYQMPPDPTVVALATDALNVIRGANAQIPRLQMPRGIQQRGHSYNIYSDNTST